MHEPTQERDANAEAEYREAYRRAFAMLRALEATMRNLPTVGDSIAKREFLDADSAASMRRLVDLLDEAQREARDLTI